MKTTPASRRPAIRTHGLTHVALAVRDPVRSLRFYQSVFGMRAVYRSQDFVQAQTPGCRDVLVFERDAARAGRSGGVTHIGFRVRHPGEIAKATRVVLRAKGTIVEQGEFEPGEPYVFAEDPDGYVVEIWYEKPTRLDPGRASRRRIRR